MKCDICDNCIKKDVCIYRDNSEICGEDYHKFVADFNVLEQIRAEIKAYADKLELCKASPSLEYILQIIDKYTAERSNKE